MFGYCLENGPNETIPEHLYLSDFLNYYHSPRRTPSEIFAEFAQNGLTASQISEQTGLSKQAVLARLREKGVRPAAGHGRRQDNYRYPNPPFGFRVVNNRLVLNPPEMKVVRLIVRLRTKERMGWEAIVIQLNGEGVLSRTGRKWDRARIKRVFKRWENKL